MTDFGTIKSYDTGNGTGTINPERGGDALPFRKSALQQQGQEPAQDQRYGYDVASSNSGKRYAINMNVQAGPETLQEQASQQRG
jgi:CspA family cold shock protein